MHSAEYARLRADPSRLTRAWMEEEIRFFNLLSSFASLLVLCLVGGKAATGTYMMYMYHIYEHRNRNIHFLKYIYFYLNIRTTCNVAYYT